MKIFDWIHRKFRHNNGLHDPSMEGKRAREERQDRCRGACESARRSTTSPRGMTMACHHGEEDGDGDGDNTDMSGLLTIGTLGLYQPHQLELESLEEGPADSESQSDVVTAFEVEIFHGQLEKAFGLKGQNNHNDQVKVECDSVCSERFSNANSNVYPLHEFFNSPSSVAVVEPSQRGAKEKRTSLGDLFSISKQDTSATSTESKNDQSHKTSKDYVPQKQGSSLASVKKAIKRKTKSHSTPGVESGCKLDKVIGFFHNKIFPEETAQEYHTARSKAGVCTRINKHKKCLGGLGLTNCILPRAREDPDDAPAHSHPHHNVTDLPDQSPPQLCAQGHWIKTDNEYVVLEL